MPCCPSALAFTQLHLTVHHGIVTVAQQAALDLPRPQPVVALLKLISLCTSCTSCQGSCFSAFLRAGAPTLDTAPLVHCSLRQLALPRPAQRLLMAAPQSTVLHSRCLLSVI